MSAAVSYYGCDIVEMLDRPLRCPCLVFFTGWDAHIPLTDVETIRAAVPESPIDVLPGGHGFACGARPSYGANSAQIARPRTPALFRKYVG
jgi:carboxymethylenebutenolidase